MLIKSTKFKKLLVLNKSPLTDKRGYFIRDFCKKELKKIKFDIKQVNISYNRKKYTLRGFHYQKKPYEEDKIITCLSGKILNVSIDIRKKSKTYLGVFKKILSDKNHQSLYIPIGFANAYLTLKPKTKILYYMSQYYKQKNAHGIRYNDPAFNIRWPFKSKVISNRDKSFRDYKI